MTTTSRRVLAAAVAAAVALSLAASPASAKTLSNGHVDVLDVDLVAGALTLNIRDSTVAPVDDNLSPSGNPVRVPPAALSTVPSGSGYSCLGTAGSAVYLLPLSESVATSLGVVWAGWNTQGVTSGPSTINLVLDPAASTVPSGGRFALYTTNLGTPTFRFNTNAATGCPRTTFGVGRNVHGHGFWAFTRAGTYTLRFRATGTGVTSSAWQTYTFSVG